jgi:murein DD-endopeptidase MepM/ murein hydrolase activator NlpD
MNLITIKHENGEQTQYIHLAKDSLVEGLDRGSKVKKGQQIAVTGMTGWTDRPHLHFLTFKLMEHPYPYHFKSLKPRFEKPQE